MRAMEKMCSMAVVLFSFCKDSSSLSKRGEPSGDTYERQFLMPEVIPTKNDDYLCTSMALNSTTEEWIIQYDPLASANRAHHMLLYGCTGLINPNAKYWDCGHHGVCRGSRIMFAWAKNAPGTHLPPDVGFRIGGKSKVQYLTLQVHYATMLPRGVNDTSGLKMTLTKTRQKSKAGIYLLVGGFVDIPPRTPKTHLDMNCLLGAAMKKPINVFGYRVHAHSLGSVITGYKYNPKTSDLSEIVKGNPQWPQAFYPMDHILRVELFEVLHARCTFNSTTRDKHTYIGMTSTDEMCNLYLMYYTDRDKGSDSGVCAGVQFPNITRNLPTSSDVALPPNPLLEAMTKGENTNKDKDISYNRIFDKTLKSSGVDAEEAILQASYGPKSKDEKMAKTYQRSIHMPGVTPKEADAYVCFAQPLNSSVEEWVVLFEPLASANRAHHMLLFGCADVQPQYRAGTRSWDCAHHGVCEGGKIMYAWAKNAPGTILPQGVGFRVGGGTPVQVLVLQIHYAVPLAPGVKDTSGLQMTITTQPQQYKAGIFLLMASQVDIPPYTQKTHADVNCVSGLTEPADIHLFAFRVHAHKLGSVISGYKFDPKENSLVEIAKGNPQWPQAFYPMERVVRVRPSDILHARCTFNSSNSIQHTYIGSTASDEMCNLYLMYYTDAQSGSESGGCSGEAFRRVSASLPPDSDRPLPPNPALERMTTGRNVNQGKEVSYSGVFGPGEGEGEGGPPPPPIALEKKTQSRKDPQQHQSEGKYKLEPSPVVEGYEDTEGEGDYAERTNSLGGRMQYYGGQGAASKDTPPVEHNKHTLVSSPRQGKNMQTESGYRLVEDWSPGKYKLGQVTGVAVDSRGDVVVFHRGDTAWDGAVFKGVDLVNQEDPIAQPTLLHLRRADGEVMYEWGANFFFMPHGLSLDADDHIWLTDVGMHQVFKFRPGFEGGKPLITLGTKFKHGSDTTHFCRPTDVVVLERTKEVFVSDGYCNARIVHFDATGKFIREFGAPDGRAFRVVHSLTAVEDRSEVCASDRENGRVVCFPSDDTGGAAAASTRQFKFDEWGGRLFAIAYTPHFGGKLFAVNGPMYYKKQKVAVFEAGFEEGNLVQTFSPFNQGLSNPHDVEVSPDGTELYVVEIGPNKVWKFMSDSVAKNRSGDALRAENMEVKTGQLKQDNGDTLSLFGGGYSPLGVSSVVLSLAAVPLLVLSTLAIVMRCRKSRLRFRRRYLEDGKFGGVGMGVGRKGVGGAGLGLGSLLNKRRGFEQVPSNDLDEDDMEGERDEDKDEDSDVEEFSLAAAKV